MKNNSKFIDSLNGYRLVFKDKDFTYGDYIIKQENGHFVAYLEGEIVITGDSLYEIEKDLDSLPKLKAKKSVKKYVVWCPNNTYSGPMYLNKKGKTTFTETEAKKYDSFKEAQRKADYRKYSIDGRNWKVRTYEI